MALNIGDNFKYQGKKPNFERDSFATKAEMKGFPEANVDEGHISFCEEDGKHYEFKAGNSVDTNTGKWREFTTNVDLSGYATKTEVQQSVANKVDKSYVDGKVEGKQDKLADGINIKTINGQPIMGKGNITIAGPDGQLDLSGYATKTEMLNNITDYNVSKHHPTEGIGGTNKFTLETAIKLIPESLRSVGIKCSFLDSISKKTETFEYQGGTINNVKSWLRTGTSFINSLNDDIHNAYVQLESTELSDLFVEGMFCNVLSGKYLPKDYEKIDGFSCLSLPVRTGDSFIITIKGGAYSGRAYAIYNNQGKQIYITGSDKLSFESHLINIEQDGYIVFNSTDSRILSVIATTKFTESWSYALISLVSSLQKLNKNFHNETTILNQKIIDNDSKYDKKFAVHAEKIKNVNDAIYGRRKSESTSWTKGYIRVASEDIGEGLQGSVDLDRIINMEGFTCLYFPCNEGDEIDVYIAGGGTEARAYSFLNSKKQVISQSSGYELINTKLVAPAESAYVVFNSNNIKSYIVYGKEADWQKETTSIRELIEKNKKSIRILCFGNSFTEDSMGYVPSVIKNITPNLDLTIAIAYIGGSPLAQHLANISGEQQQVDSSIYNPMDYILHKSINGSAWVTTPGQNVDAILGSEEWDIITFQQNGGTAPSDWNIYYKPFIFKLQKALFDKLTESKKKTKLGWILTQGAYFDSDETALSKWQGTAENAKKIMKQTGFDVLFPFGTGVQNLRSTSLKVLGDGSAHNLCADNGHLQEGIGCLVAAYTNALVIAQLAGYNVGIVGEKTRPDKSFLEQIKMPGQNLGTSGVIGITDKNCYLAQISAIAAIKSPYEVTDISVME